MRVKIVLLAMGLVACRPRSADDCMNIDAGDRVSCKVPGWVDRAFDLDVPASWDGVAPLPVIVAYHGGGGNREAARRVTCPGGELGDAGCLDAIATARGYAVVRPDGTSSRLLRDVRTWNGGGTAYCASGAACAQDIDDVGYTDDLLAAAGAAIPIDTHRVYATGLSNGGAMSHRLGCARGATFAAIAPVGGANQYADDGGACGTMPVLHIHGTDDRCWPFAGGGGDCIDKTGRKTSVDETMAAWATRNGCATTFVDTPLPDRAADGATSFRRTWNGCARSTQLIVMQHAGHTWPSGWSYSARAGRVTTDFGSDVIVDFFEAHPRP